MANEAVVETLRLIWGEMKALNSKASRTNERLESLEERFQDGMAGLKTEMAGMKSEMQALREHAEETRDGLLVLADRVTEGEMRVASEVVALAGIVRELRDNLVTAGQTRIALIENRLARVEKRLDEIGPHEHSPA